MSYGDPKWNPMGNWILGEEEGFKHIKAAYVHLSILMMYTVRSLPI